MLDQIEGYDALGADNEYVRVATVATLENGETCEAYVYRFASDARLKKLRPIEPFQPFAGKLCAAWPDSLARVPRSFEEE